MSKSSEVSTTEVDKEVSSSRTSSSLKFLDSGITSVGICEIMELGCSTDCAAKISLQSLSFYEMLSLIESSLKMNGLPAVFIALSPSTSIYNLSP